MSAYMSNIGAGLISQAVFRLFEVTSRGFWEKRRQFKDMQTFITCPDTETYVYRKFANGDTEMRRVFSAKEVGTLEGQDVLLQVNTKPLVIEMCFAGLTAFEGTGLDLTVSAQVLIREPREFLTEQGLNWVRSANTVSVTLLEGLLLNQCKQAVIDEVRSVTYDDLKHRDALPLAWWKSKLPGWFKFQWLELVEIKDVQYVSPVADNARDMAQHQKLMDRELESQQQIHQQEVQLLQDQRAYEEAKAELEANRLLSEQQRQAELEQAKMAFEKVTIEARQEIDLVKARAEKERVKLEAEIDRIRSREDLAAERMKQAEESEKRMQDMLEQYEMAKSELGNNMNLLKDAIKEGVADAKRVSEHAGQLSSGTLALLGRAQGPAYLAQIFREKLSSSPQAILMKKVELRTRDIGNKKVDTLAINTDLQFEFMANQAGYATLLNIGTSGKVWLHGPNAYIGIEDSKVESGKRYTVPGAELLPNGQLAQQGLGYIEVGPPGWEELIVVVTGQPLMTTQDVFPSTISSPFVELSTQRIDELIDQLAELEEESWTCGVLSFLVE